MKKTALACAALLTVCSAVSVLEASGIVATYDPVTQKVTMVDSTNGAVLISPTNAMKVYDTSWDFVTGETPLAPTSITFTPHPDGYDIEILLVNNTGTSQRVGTMWVANMPFQSTTRYRSFDYFRYGDIEGDATWNQFGNWFPGGTVYPGCYSPAHVIRGSVEVPLAMLHAQGAGEPQAKVELEGTSTSSFAGGGGGETGGGGQDPKDKVEPIPEPVMAEYAIGISLQYPVLDYDVSVYKAQQALNGQWRFGFHVNPKWRSTTGPCGPSDPPCTGLLSPWYNPNGDIPPYNAQNPNANRRTYKYSVRVLRNPSTYPPLPAEWLRTLEPYREYFQKTYGAPRYAPDYRPIEGISMALMELYNQDPTGNPYGFDTTFRPDLNGWNGIVNDLVTQRASGWPRQVLWAPTGINGIAGGSTNYRYEFTSRWNDPSLAAMKGSEGLLTDFAFDHGGIGLWWGRSTEVMSNWNSTAYTLMDQTNTTLRARAFEELDGARAVGATDIGLDQYILPRRRGFAWLQEMRLRYPEMRFCGEAFQPDIIHLLSANYELVGSTPQATDQSACNPPRPLIRPLAMPDFLLHKHETWAASWVSWINDNACNGQGWNLNTPAMAYWPEYVASQGYVPLINLWSGANRSVNTALATATPSYSLSVPSDLQTPYCPQITSQPVHTYPAECGTDIMLSATAVSPRSLALSYQWYFRPQHLDPTNDVLPTDLINGMMGACSDNTKWANETTNTLTIHVQPKTLGTYALLVTEPNGGPTWSAYTRVYAIGDADQDGDIDSDDVYFYMDLFFDPLADQREDVNRDGVINSSDFYDFMAAYFAGC